MKRGLIILVITAILVFMVHPPVAQAAGHAVGDGDTLDLSTGTLTHADSSTETYSIADGDTVSVAAGAAVTITGTKNVGISCGAGVTLTLDGVTITNSAGSALTFTGSGNTLILASASALTGSNGTAAVRVEGSTTLEIRGSGSLNAQGGFYAAGIGGNNGFDCGNISITGGTINTEGGFYGGGAGLGGGYGAGFGHIAISDTAHVTAVGNGGAGVGSGAGSSSSGTITISGGTVNATGKPAYFDAANTVCGAAGIGGGIWSDGGTITISGGTVTAQSSNYGAGIGTGDTGGFPWFYNNTVITISGGDVTALGGGQGGGAGIGGGYLTDGGTIRITGGTVDASSNGYASGIGGGAGIDGDYYGNSTTIDITGGVMYAMRGNGADYDIGSFSGSDSDTISISGGAAVFLGTDSISPALATTTHTHYGVTAAQIAGGKFMGIPVPDWTAPYGAYLIENTLEYDANSGVGTEPAAVTQAVGTAAVVASGDALTKECYMFSGWNTAADGSGDAYEPGDTFTFTGAATLYAQWTGNPYMVKYNANGGTGSMSDSVFTYGTSQELTLNSFTRTGHTFAGWAESADGAVIYTDAQSVKNLTTENNGTVTLYAQWTVVPVLTSSNARAEIYVGGRIVLTPNIEGGEWNWDEAYFSATFNSSATFTALKAGTSTITYMVDGVNVTYEVTIKRIEVPNTGQDLTWPWLTAAGAILIFAAALTLTFRKRAARG
jgi:uncharacterized repeat protein (TIGR02543 family)/LPXTG-motif cell wall-anchored protein